MKWIASFFIFLFLFSSRVSAQSSEWIIHNFSSDIQIESSGEVNVSEKISAEFFVQKHGIYRDIPYKYTNKDGSKYYTEITNIKVPNHTYSVSKEGDFVRIKIGDPDKLVAGLQQYTIHYTVVGVLRGFSSHDELYWNVTGSYWEVPIESTSAHISIPSKQITEISCYVGATGSQETCKAQKDGLNAYISSRTIQSGEGVTVVASYPQGVTALPVVKSFGQKLISLPAILTFLFVFGIGTLSIFLLWSQKGRDFWYKGTHLFDPNAKEEKRPFFGSSTVVVEYTSPEKLRPAEIGVIMDERADTLDITASIIDLASRGYLNIVEEKKKWVFGSQDYTFIKKPKSTAGLLAYEKELLDRLFDGQDTVKMSALKQKFYTDLKKVKEQLYANVVEKGFFPSNPEKVRMLYMIPAIIIMVVCAIVFFSGLGSENEFLFMIGVGGAITGLNLLITSQFMSRKTAKGYEMSRRIKGYRLFIENVEKHRQKFFESKNMFNEVLPYVIVFGLTTKFAKALEKIGYTPDKSTLTWYQGASLMNLSNFQSSMSSFSQSLGTAMASTPSSSGGSGGGGFSGGGFGGGGGGSW